MPSFITPEIICMAFCIIHFIVDLISHLLTGKRIKSLCSDCHMPIYEGEEHTCFSAEQKSEILKFLDEVLKK